VRKSEILVGLDIGSSRIKVIVADVRERELPEILGVGSADSAGVEAGVVVNLERASAAIAAAIERAEESAEVDIGRVAATIDGEHIKGIDSRGVIAVSRTGGEITASEVATVLDAARTLALPVGRTILDVLPQEFFVDGQRGIRDPIGMSGVRLGSKVHIVTASQQAVETVQRAVRKIGVKAGAVSLRSVAAASACLSDDEKELGVLLVNLGSDTTGLTLYHNGAVRHTATVGWGSSSITNDIAVGLRVPLKKAQQLKHEAGCALSSLVEDEDVPIPSVGGHPPRTSSKGLLAAIIEPRAREILELVVSEVRNTDYWGRTPAGVVLTGGGARLLGMTELAEEVFGTPARVGIPDRVSGRIDAAVDPSYAAAVGVIAAQASGPGAGASLRREIPLAGTVQRVREWVDSLL